jgi:hypothetical protein
VLDASPIDDSIALGTYFAVFRLSLDLFAMKYTLFFVSALAMPLSLLGAFYQPKPLHNYKYYDFLDYTSWDFGSYQNIDSKSFRGYLDHRLFANSSFSIYFFPKVLGPKFDNTKLIPLDRAEAHIKRINQITFSKYEKEQIAAPVEHKKQEAIKVPEKRIVSQAGGLAPAYNNTPVPTSSASPLLSKQRAALPLSPEDVLLFLKKKIPNGGDDASLQQELLIPFQTPGSLSQPHTSLPSQAIYTQE